MRTAKNFKVFHMNGDGLRTCAPVKSIKTSQQVFIGFKNLPTGYYRKLKTSGQSMCSNGRLAIETSVKSIIPFNTVSLQISCSELNKTEPHSPHTCSHTSPHTCTSNRRLKKPLRGRNVYQQSQFPVFVCLSETRLS